MEIQSLNHSTWVCNYHVVWIPKYRKKKIFRIKDVTLTDKRICFDIPEVEPGTFGLPWHEPRTFQIRFKPGKASDYVRERIWADRQTLEELDDGGVMLEITTRSEPELRAWVRSFGDEAKLLEKSFSM